MPGFSRGKGVPRRRGRNQLGNSTNPNKCIAYPRTLNPTQYTLAWTKLFPDLSWTGYSQQAARIIPGVKAAQARLYQGIIYNLGQFIPRGIL